MICKTIVADGHSNLKDMWGNYLCDQEKTGLTI